MVSATHRIKWIKQRVNRYINGCTKFEPTKNVFISKWYELYCKVCFYATTRVMMIIAFLLTCVCKPLIQWKTTILAMGKKANICTWYIVQVENCAKNDITSVLDVSDKNSKKVFLLLCPSITITCIRRDRFQSFLVTFIFFMNIALLAKC